MMQPSLASDWWSFICSDSSVGHLDGTKSPVSDIAESFTTCDRLVKFEENFPDIFNVVLDLLSMKVSVGCCVIDHLLFASSLIHEPSAEGHDLFWGSLASLDLIGHESSNSCSFADGLDLVTSEDKIDDLLGTLKDGRSSKSAILDRAEAIEVDKLTHEDTDHLGEIDNGICADKVEILGLLVGSSRGSKRKDSGEFHFLNK